MILNNSNEVAPYSAGDLVGVKSKEGAGPTGWHIVVTLSLIIAVGRTSHVVCCD